VKRLACLLGLLLLLPAGSASAAPRCRSGQGLTIDGRLRIFGVPTKRDQFGNGGWEDFACLGRRGRALNVGADIEGGDGGVQVEGWAFGGGRYLAVDSLDDGENGGDVTYSVYDLRRRRLIATRHPRVFDDIDPRAFRVTARGELVTLYAGAVQVGSRRVSARGEYATDVALGAGTLYWTANGAARLAPLPGAAPDDLLDQPLFLDNRNACMRRPGATVARSPEARVLRRDGQLLACGFLRKGTVALPSDARVKIVEGRWLLATDAATTQVFDMDRNTGPLTAPGATAPLLGADGALPFTDAMGELAVQAPGMAAPATLSPPGFSAPAVGHDVVYWTAGGAPQRFSFTPPALSGRQDDARLCAVRLGGGRAGLDGPAQRQHALGQPGRGRLRRHDLERRLQVAGHDRARADAERAQRAGQPVRLAPRAVALGLAQRAAQQRRHRVLERRHSLEQQRPGARPGGRDRIDPAVHRRGS
jgi:hypothetical protein